MMPTTPTDTGGSPRVVLDTVVGLAEIEISFRIKDPGGYVMDDLVVEWLRYELGDSSAICTSNPMVDEPVEPIEGSLQIRRGKERIR